MNQHAHAGLQDAFSNAVAGLYTSYTLGVIGKEQGALERFKAGLALHRDAMTKAGAAIDEIFPPK